MSLVCPEVVLLVQEGEGTGSHRSLGVARWRERGRKNRAHEQVLFCQRCLTWHLCPSTKCTGGMCSLINVHRGHVFRVTAAPKMARDCPSGPPCLLLPPLRRPSFFLLKGSYCPDFLAYFSVLYKLKYIAHVL